MKKPELLRRIESFFWVGVLLLVGCRGAAEVATSGTCTTRQALNLRQGPGTSYNPPLRALPTGTVLDALAFSPIGFPGGQWVFVRDSTTGDEGWVSAGEAFVRCTVNVDDLPVSEEFPPTPAVSSTATPAQLAVAPPRITNSAPGGTTADYVISEVLVNDSFLFRIAVADTRFGDYDGAGISHVDYFISTSQGQTVYSRREESAAYCVFSGGDPNCNPWPFEGGQFRWGVGGQAVEEGDYHVTILVTPQDPAFEGEVWNWDFDFTVALP
jgi:hypothetical protein